MLSGGMRTDRFPLIAAVAVLLVTPALAGCMGTAGATAMEHRDVAQEEAAAWSSGAALLQIVGVEGSWNLTTAFSGSAGAAETSYWERAMEDRSPGNGHAEVWVYRFEDPDDHGVVFTVVVDRAGEVLDTKENERSGGMAPVGSWSLDSDEAMEVALRANNGLRDASQAENFGIVSVLQQSEGREDPVWLIAGGGGGPSGGGGGSVMLDAVSGDVLQSQGGFAPR